MSNSESYEIGYKKPPKATRFKKGQSGNPGGRRPKPVKERFDIVPILEEAIPVSRRGVRTKMPSFEATLRVLAKRAIRDGNFGAAFEFVRICEDYDLIAPAVQRVSSGVLVVPKDMNWDEWMRRFKRYGPPPWSRGNHSGVPGGRRAPKPEKNDATETKTMKPRPRGSSHG